LRTKVWALTLIRGIFSVLSPNAFPTFGNLLNVLNQASLTMIIAGGLTVAVVVGELDLSIGFAASYAGVLVTGFIANQGVPVLLAILLVLGCPRFDRSGQWASRHQNEGNSVIVTLGIGTLSWDLRKNLGSAKQRSLTQSATESGIRQNLIENLVLWVFEKVRYTAEVPIANPRFR
jgi:ribose/xylose/arabinose/galactoside ABC-type transport system permease subunit